MVHNSKRLGLLRNAGRRVRRTRTTASSVNSEMTNQVVWNVASSAWKTSSRVANVTRSKTELISPKTIMKRCTSLMLPALRPRDGLGIDVVGRDRDRRHVRQEVVEQDLLGGERQERQQRRRQRHADHVAEIRAGRDADIFERVGEGAPAVLDAAAQNVEVALQQDDVGALAGDVDRLVDRDADIGRMQRRRIVDAVAEIADRMPDLLQGADDPLLLLGIDLDEEIGARRAGAKAPRP